jgi:hypothetical protein
LLTSLLTHPLSHRTKVIKKESILHPPKLPERAVDRNSDEARLLGPFSKRREVNIRWQYFKTQLRNVYPPLEVMQPSIENSANPGFDTQTVIGFKRGALKHINELSGLVRKPTIPRREQKLLEALENVCDNPPQVTDKPRLPETHQLPTRWLRRRYRELLSKVPVVAQVTGKNGGTQYEISLSRHALSHETKGTPLRVGVAKHADLGWIEKASMLPTISTKK